MSILSLNYTFLDVRTLRRSLLYLLCVSNQHLYKKTSGSCSAWVNQGCSENTTENVIVKSGKDNLSDFQKDKFCHFFSHVLDQDSDQLICKGIYWLLTKFLCFCFLCPFHWISRWLIAKYTILISNVYFYVVAASKTRRDSLASTTSK